MQEGYITARDCISVKFRIREAKMVPVLYPESVEFQAMLVVIAMGYMSDVPDWVCIKAVNPHLDWPREQTVGTRNDVSHIAVTPPGFELSARV